MLAGGAVGASLEVAHADTLADTCEGNNANGYLCNLEDTIDSPGSITVNVSSGVDNENVNVSWTVSCTDGSGSQPQEGATDNASTDGAAGGSLNVPLAPLPSNAADGSCTVNVGISVSSSSPGGGIVYTGELNYTAAGSTSTSTSSAPVHPVKGYDGKCLDDKRNSSANGAEIVIWSCSGTDQAENWKYSNDEFIHNGKCMNDQGGGGNRSHVILYSCNGASNEKWIELANGELLLKAHNETLCLDDPCSSTKNGTQLIVYTCKDSANQKWPLP